MKNMSLKIGIDLDDTITYCEQFFSLMTNSMRDIAEIHIITNREQTPENKAEIEKELDALGIYHDHLEITANKTEYILNNGITVFFDDTDEYFLDLPESVRVFKMRETWNFDFENHKWIYNDKTGRNIGM